MIQMPRRNVTRFFIPLIDVLILLFCIFLLMDFNAESKADAQGEMVDDQSEAIENRDAELRKRTKELYKFEELRPQLEDLEKLLKRIAELEKANQQNLQQRAFFRIIDIDGNDGALSFYDDSTEMITKLGSKESVDLLIKKHRDEAKNREVYYYFKWPRPFVNHPNQGDLKRYRQWFGTDVANSLAEK